MDCPNCTKPFRLRADYAEHLASCYVRQAGASGREDITYIFGAPNKADASERDEPQRGPAGR